MVIVFMPALVSPPKPLDLLLESCLLQHHSLPDQHTEYFAVYIYILKT